MSEIDKDTKSDNNKSTTLSDDLVKSAMGGDTGVNVSTENDKNDDLVYDDPIEDSNDDKQDKDSSYQKEDFVSKKPKADDLNDKIVFVNRCAKVVKGGRRFSFSALIVAGDGNGWVGYGFGKANEATEAITKATKHAKKNINFVKRRGQSIPHQVHGKYNGGKVMLKPASEGTGVVAGGGMRAVLEMAGIKDVLAKSLGSQNHGNVVKATLHALSQLRTKQEILALRS